MIRKTLEEEESNDEDDILEKDDTLVKDGKDEKEKKDKENEKYCINAVEWKRSLNNALASNDLEMFLVKHCNIPAPADQARELQWKKQVNVHSSSQLSRLQALVREQKIKMEIVKKEPS